MLSCEDATGTVGVAVRTSIAVAAGGNVGGSIRVDSLPPTKPMIMHDDASTRAATLRRRWFCATYHLYPSFTCILPAPLSWSKGPLDILNEEIENVAAFKRIHHGIAIDNAAFAAFEACGVANCPVTQYQRPRP